MPDFLLLVVSLVLAVSGCSVRVAPTPEKVFPSVSMTAARADDSVSSALANLAEVERRGGYKSGYGLFESGLRTKAGDLAGAVIAAYKDLAYAFDLGQVDSRTLEEGIAGLESGYSATGSGDAAEAFDAMKAVRSFVAGDWEGALAALGKLPERDLQADSFARWMELASTLRLEGSASAALESYALLQSRYSLLPGYWYGFALSQDETGLMRDSAQRCIALAPQGPLAGGARAMIAVSYGLEPSDSGAVLVPAEIESIIRLTLETENPAVLEAMLPVLGLADNPATLYAVGALRSLCAVAEVRAWLLERTGTSVGRSAERLRYIAGR